MSDLLHLAGLQQSDGALVQVDAEVVAGTTWHWDCCDFEDETGAPFDFDGCTMTVTIVDNATKQTVLTAAAVSPEAGRFTVTVTPAQNSAAAGTAGQSGRQCRWRCEITRAGVVVQAWGPFDSSLTIKPNA